MSQLQSGPWTDNVLAPMYRVVVTLPDERGVERRLREVITRKRGVLHWLVVDRSGCAGRANLHLGARRIDDVLAALEGAGFDVSAVIATRAPGCAPVAAERAADALGVDAARARSSNL